MSSLHQNTFSDRKISNTTVVSTSLNGPPYKQKNSNKIYDKSSNITKKESTFINQNSKEVVNINIEYSKYYDTNLKEDIYVNFTRVINHYSEVGTNFAIETDIINIPNINSDEFGICHFKKTNTEPLKVLCLPDNEGVFPIGKKDEEWVINNIVSELSLMISQMNKK